MMAVLWALMVQLAPEGPAVALTVGSKKFTESVILGEIVQIGATSMGMACEHRAQLGGTRFLWEALLAGDIDVYPEYTGTLRFEILASQEPVTSHELRELLRESGVYMSAPLGFNNSYALGVLPTGSAGGLNDISDLAGRPDLRLMFSNEFMDREDGWPALANHYQLTHRPRGLDHDLAYRGLIDGQFDVIDLYTTDAEIEYYQLKVLRDDLSFFPAYEAVLLVRQAALDGIPELHQLLSVLEGQIDVHNMRALNAGVKVGRQTERKVAADYWSRLTGNRVAVEEASGLQRFLTHSREHLYLVLISMVLAMALALPLGIVGAYHHRTGQWVLAVVAALQTIPTLALLVFMIPFFGIGAAPAIAALFVYSLLPMVRNTITGLRSLDPELREIAFTLGLRGSFKLLRIDLPLAAPAILAGIKTSAVINVGTATLGALIGAGGYGSPILTGIRLDDMGLIMEGALPAAGLALLVQWLLDLADRVLVPKGLRLGRIPKVKRH